MSFLYNIKCFLNHQTMLSSICSDSFRTEKNIDETGNELIVIEIGVGPF